MHDNVPWRKLGKYIAGDCNPQEHAEVAAWIDADLDHPVFVVRLKEIWEKSSAETEWDVDEGWHELSRKLAKRSKSNLRLLESPLKESEKSKKAYNKRLSARKRWTGMRVAASVALLIAVLVYVLVQQGQVQ